MTIREATFKDAPQIRLLLKELGYEATVSKLIMMIETLFSGKENELLVAVSGNDVLGFVSAHYVPQLGVDGDLLLVSYFAVDESARRSGVGKALEEQLVLLAKKRFCNRIELHCSVKREAAHRFYKELGYSEHPTYFSKKLV